MDTLKKIIVFVIVPVLIVVLLYVNGSLQAAKYEDKTIDLKQYDASITTHIESIKANPNEKFEIPLTIKNLGTMVWMKDDKNSINLSYHIFNEDDEVILYDGERTSLTKSVKSGETIDLNAVVQAPNKVGIYYIEFDMVYEGVTWFKDKGSKTLKVRLEVDR